jgi:hypothetical protein
MGQCDEFAHQRAGAQDRYDHDLTPLPLEGAAYLKADHAELWQLFTEMVVAGKIDAGNLTGVTLLLGLMLRSERSRH